MPTLCPICNGLHTLEAICDACSINMEDHGRLEQLYGPYSPYREIDHIKLTNGYADVYEQQCIHVGICPNCSFNKLFFIQEI